VSLAKKYRFPVKSQYCFLLSKGKKKDSPLFNLIYSLGNQANGFRAAVLVSKRTDKRSTARNRIKRKVYRALSEIIGNNFLNSGDLIIKAKKDNLNQKQLIVTQELKNLLANIGIIKDVKMVNSETN